MKKLLSRLLMLLAVTTLAACSDGGDDLGKLDNNVLDLSQYQLPPHVIQGIIDASEDDPSKRLDGSILGKPVTIVKLRGKTNHFGRHLDGSYIDYWATVPDTLVWFAEIPWTRDQDIKTDETGWFTLYIVKDTGKDLDLSFIYEKEDWITTKTNVHTIVDEDDVDLAIQYIDPDFFNFLMRPYVEGMMQDNGYPNFFFETAMVVTVGKSWSSMHSDALPHGDPGATMTISPESPTLIGPVYFNEAVIPDIEWTSTSVDGGVTWLNMPLNQTYHISAVKEGVNYPTVKFHLTDADIAAGVQLFIASPPDSLEGDNDSPPGEY